MSPPNALPSTVRASWHGFLDTYEPLRSDLWAARHRTRARGCFVSHRTSRSIGRAALHRARGKLVEPPREEESAPAPAVLDAFCDAFNAGDIDRLTALLLDTASVEVVGATTQYGKEAARRTVLHGILFGVKRLATADVNGGIEARFMQGILPRAPRVEARAHRGAWVLVHWYGHHDGEAVRALTRIETDGDRAACLKNYFFDPDLVAEVCAELGLPSRSNGYRWFLPNR